MTIQLLKIRVSNSHHAVDKVRSALPAAKGESFKSVLNGALFWKKGSSFENLQCNVVDNRATFYSEEGDAFTIDLNKSMAVCHHTESEEVRDIAHRFRSGMSAYVGKVGSNQAASLIKDSLIAMGSVYVDGMHRLFGSDCDDFVHSLREVFGDSIRVSQYALGDDGETLDAISQDCVEFYSAHLEELRKGTDKEMRVDTANRRKDALNSLRSQIEKAESATGSEMSELKSLVDSVTASITVKAPKPSARSTEISEGRVTALHVAFESGKYAESADLFQHLMRNMLNHEETFGNERFKVTFRVETARTYSASVHDEKTGMTMPISASQARSVAQNTQNFLTAFSKM